jgi:HD-GYP domain-containing protein (c-di-GMP phosphodiesterase class II)
MGNSGAHGDLKVEMHKLRGENEQLRRFLEIGKTICVERDIDQLLPLIMTNISRALSADRSTLFLVDWDRMEIWTKFAEGLEADTIKINLKMGIVGVSVFTRQLVNVSNAYEDPRFNPEIDEVTGFRTESILSAPFLDKEGDVNGVVELLNKKSGIFTKEDEERMLATTEKLKEIQFDDVADREKAIALYRELREATQCDRGSLFLIDREKAELFSIMAEGLPAQDIHLSLNLGIAGLTAITGEELNIEDAYADPRFDKGTDERTGYRTRCILCVPIKNQTGDVLGVIQAINKQESTFVDSDLEVLRALSSFVAISIENAILFQEQNRQFESILEVLGASIDAKDHLTAGHSEKVTKYAIGIGRELGLTESDIDVLRVAALLHDYGKLGTDENILKKPGRLTPAEFEHVKQHVVLTKKILDKMHLLRKYRNVPLIASSHHERLDGSGYINGLKEHEIPFMTKIITVADVFEALTAKRHYRQGLSSEKAFEVLREGIGTEFDENVVMAMLRYWDKRSGS